MWFVDNRPVVLPRRTTQAAAPQAPPVQILPPLRTTARPKMHQRRVLASPVWIPCCLWTPPTTARRSGRVSGHTLQTA